MRGGQANHLNDPSLHQMYLLTINNKYVSMLSNNIRSSKTKIKLKSKFEQFNSFQEESNDTEMTQELNEAHKSVRMSYTATVTHRDTQ